MNNKLTVHLLHTIPSKSLGLTLTLRVVKVSSNLETFNERQDPAASIMAHGLFLLQPTPIGVRDPMLLALLNQKLLKDEEPATRFGVFWSSQETYQVESNSGPKIFDEFEEYLGKRAPRDGQEGQEYFWMKQCISLIKNGIIKSIGSSFTFDFALAIHSKRTSLDSYSEPFCVQSIPDLTIPLKQFEVPESLKGPNCSLTPLMAYPVSPALVFAAYMRYIYEIHEDFKKMKTSNSVITPEVSENHQSSGRKEKAPCPPIDINLHLLDAFPAALESMHSSLVHLKSLLLPVSPADSKAYESAAKSIQDQVHDLASLINSLLLMPFIETLRKLSVSAILSNTKILRNDCQEISKGICNMQKLAEMGKTPFGSISLKDLEACAPKQIELQFFSILGAIRKCLTVPSFSKHFFSLIEPALLVDNLNSGYLQQMAEGISNNSAIFQEDKTYRLMRNYITEGFERVGDDFLNVSHAYKCCMVRSAKNTTKTLKFRHEEPTKDRTLIAIIASGETKVCISPQNWIYDHKPQPPPKVHISVIKTESQVCSFEVPVDYSTDSFEVKIASIQHFTGRFFVRFENAGDWFRPSEVTVLDLLPCFQAPPAAPRAHSRPISELINQKNQVPIVYACTDKFFSVLCVDRITAGKRDQPKGKPATLGIIQFDGEKGLSEPISIPCAKLFDKIVKKISLKKVYRDSSRLSHICWMSNCRTLFYIYWKVDEQSYQNSTLFIACFELSPALDSMQTLTYWCYNLDHLFVSGLTSAHKPKFRTLKLHSREYLVMDATSQQTPPIRAFFALHKRKLHWVPVNGALLAPLPAHIGFETQCPGYNTNRVSTFHHRRMFSSDKVVHVLYRLHYR